MSNRLTFSLASLIFLIALGLVFAPMSVMADNDGKVDDNHGTDGHANQDNANAEEDAVNNGENHQHPSVSSIKVMAVADTTIAKAAISGTNVIPVSADGMKQAPVADATAAENTATHSVDGVFKVRITFDRPIVEDDQDTTYNLLSSELTMNAIGENGRLTIAGTASGDVIGMSIAPVDANGSTAGLGDVVSYDLTFTIDYPDTGTAVESTGDNINNPYRHAPINIFIGVDNDSVDSKPQLDTGTGSDNPGAGNFAYATKKIFTIVTQENTRPTLDITTTAPTDTVAASTFDIEYTTTDANDDTVTVAATHTVVPSGAMAHYTLDTTVAGTVTVTRAMPTATTPTIPAAAVTVTITPSDAYGAGVAKTFIIPFAADTYTAPNNLPTVTTDPATAPTAAVTANSYSFTYTGADADSGDTVTVGVASAVAPTTAATHYTVDSTTTAGTVMVTQTGTPTATVPIPAATVTVTLTPNDGTADGTAVDFAVKFTEKTYTPPALADGTYNFPAKSYVIVAKTTSPDGLPTSALPANTAEGASATKIKAWDGIPNLEDLLYRGGTIALTVTKAADGALFDHDADGADPTTGKKADGTDGTKPRQYAARDLIITEVMAARDTAKKGTDAETSHQWIEIYNPNKTAITATLKSKSGRPALDAESTEVLLDRVSSVVGGGWEFTGLGQDGSTATNATVAFKSFYRKERGKDGHVKAHWATSTDTYFANHIGTPGAAERKSASVLTATSIPRTPVIFNEIANRSDADKAYEWIELSNVSDAEANLKNWQISIAQAVDSDKEFFNFFDKDIKIPAGGLLLLVASDPSDNPDHPLAAGYNIEKGANDQTNGVNADSPRYLVMKAAAKDENGQRGLRIAAGLPDDGEFVLILRNGNDKEATHEKVIDIAGYDTDLSVNSADKFTGLWPLVNYPKPDIALNKLEVDKVHRRQKADIDGTRTADKKDNADHVALRDVGWTGIGYKRNAAATAAHGGTPGYDNGALKSDGADAIAAVRISEIMVSSNRNYPQWIELHNASKVHGANIDNWSIFIVNHNNNADGTEYAGKLTERIDLDGKIPPGQTSLIVARRGSSDTNLPAARIHSGNKKRTEELFNPYGFQITLKAKTNEGDANKHQTIDMVGNLSEAPANTRRADAQSFLDVAWMVPASVTEDGQRESLVRVPKTGGYVDGTKAAGWKPFDMSSQISQGTWYGHRDDLGNPGYTQGGVLPVSLSKFRPERLKNTGEIVIRWITESELNNAGFNILRSEKRDGEFKQINTKLIAGKGTTSERTTYEWKDTSAKPNVVYYYQIQDVSLDGQVQTLRQSRLKGNVTAAGKLTTTWGALKALQ